MATRQNQTKQILDLNGKVDDFYDKIEFYMNDLSDVQQFFKILKSRIENHFVDIKKEIQQTITHITFDEKTGKAKFIYPYNSIGFYKLEWELQQQDQYMATLRSTFQWSIALLLILFLIALLMFWWIRKKMMQAQTQAPEGNTYEQVEQNSFL